MKYSFKNDYSEGCHEKILQVLVRTNGEQTVGYGEDPYCRQAREAIRQELKGPAEIYFLTGGTQTNLLAISALLRPHECAVGTELAHIHTHETGAVEATGHKILTVPPEHGKLTARRVETLLQGYTDHHMVKPRLLYISNATEVGTVYTKEEIQALRELCDRRDLYLFLDGARLSSALCAEGSCVTLEDLRNLCHVFTIGGTKSGALFGEALVFSEPELARDFAYMVKQKGALLAKGRLLGLQFLTLFQPGDTGEKLLYEIGRQENQRAMALRKGLEELGIPFLEESPSNQQFPILENALLQAMEKDYAFETMGAVDESHTCIRLVCSFMTPASAVEEFLQDLRRKMEALSF